MGISATNSTGSKPSSTEKSSSNAPQAAMQESAENLQIWNQVKDTDSRYTKPLFGGDGSNLTSINSTYQIYRATNLFGPCGSGWGYEIENENYIQGPALYPERPEAGNHTLHVLRVKVWYKHKGDIATVSHFGQTVLTSLDVSGKVKFDEDAPKKSLTDGISKCLSILGFSADIYSGQMDAKVKDNEPKNSKNPEGNTTAVTASTPAATPAATAATLASLSPTPESIAITKCTSLEDLMKVWGNLTEEQRGLEVNKLTKDSMKDSLSKPATV